MLVTKIAVLVVAAAIGLWFCRKAWRNRYRPRTITAPIVGMVPGSGDAGVDLGAGGPSL